MRRIHAFRARTRQLLDDSIDAARSLTKSDPAARSAYERLLLTVRSRTGLLRPSGRPSDNRNHINAALLALALHHRDWLRSVEVWSPASQSERVLFASLACHLLARYPIPACLTSVWFELPPGEVLPQHAWFKHLGLGHSLRTAGLPCRVTRKMSHWLFRAPHHFGAIAAIRWAQVKSLGGDDRLADAVAASRLGRQLNHEGFWESVLSFIVGQRSLDVSQVGPIVDFLEHQKYECRERISADGVLRKYLPPRPDYDIKGRTLASILRDVEHWHHELGWEASRRERRWEPSGIDDFRFVDGCESNGDMRVWTITELLSARELMLEGSAQRHCVAAYIGKCRQRRASIWSMQVENGTGRHRVLTIEVDPVTRSLCQIRGKCNRFARDGERRILEMWAIEHGLRIEDTV